MRDNMHSQGKQFSKRIQSLRECGEDMLVYVGMVKKNILSVKKNIHIDMETTDSTLGIQTSQDLWKSQRSSSL